MAGLRPFSPIQKNNKKIEQFSIIYLTHCAQSVKIVLTIRNNPCKNMGDILEKGDDNMANDDWDIFDKQIKRTIEISRKTMDLCIQPYIKELAIYKRALELENEERFKNIDGIWMIKNGKRTKFINNAEELTNYFLDKAKKELEEQE